MLREVSQPVDGLLVDKQLVDLHPADWRILIWLRLFYKKDRNSTVRGHSTIL
jgi:hypothetical protein